MSVMDKNERVVVIDDQVLVRGKVEKLDQVERWVEIRLWGVGTGTTNPRPDQSILLKVPASAIEKA